MVKKESIVKTYTGLRKENLIRNNGKYVMYDKPLGMPIGLTTDVYYNEKGKPQHIHKNGLLGYTYDVNGEYGKELNNGYGRNVDEMRYYSMVSVKPNFSVNDYEGYSDYLSYVGDVYGMRESYAGHLMGLMGVRDGLENVAYDIFPNAEGKTFADTINEILQYTDIKYAMEGDRVGIVRNIDVASALKGVITTNVNNYSGKDTRLGMISNQMYARTLSNAAHFNSLRRTKYITPELDRFYGNNLSNVYNLSSLFILPTGELRLIEPVTEDFIKEYDGDDINDYITQYIPDFKINNNEKEEWNKHDKYFGFSKSVKDESEVTRRMNPDLTDVPKMRSSDMVSPSTTYRFFEEGDSSNGNAYVSTLEDFNALDGFNAESIEIKKGKSNILDVTNKLFKNRLVETLVGRFHTSKDKDNTLTQSAVHPVFGLSKGRNLLTKTAWENPKGGGEDVNGYDNPYCRVWTYHNQYSKMVDLIRPFTDNDAFMGIGELQKDWKIFRNFKGEQRLDKHSVLNKNGMVNITPTDDLNVDVKQCMFSIENLAWKDVNISGNGSYRLENGEYVRDYQNTLSEEQRGPNGGRIMWFPPYDIDFQETSSADWHEDVFIGRGEPIYTYTNTRRNGTLSFTLLIDHPSVLNYWMLDKKDGSDSVNHEQTLLRYFAGCEPISPSEKINDAVLNGDYIGGDKNITPVMMGTDIIFNTYFPNNYSGVDFGDKEEALDVIFGGQYLNDKLSNFEGTLENFADDGETLFLGYEMGLNPISSAFFKGESETNLKEKTLAEVLNKEKVDEKYKDREFKEIENSGITKEKFFSEGEAYILYNRKENVSVKTECEDKIRSLENEKNALQTELNTLQEELKNLVSGTVEYTLLLEDIEKVENNITAKDNLITINRGLIDMADETVGTVNTVFGEINTQPFVKTQPIYCFYKNTNSGETISDKTESGLTKEIAYAKYLLEESEIFKTEEEFLKNGITNKICRVKKGKEGVEYYTTTIEKTSNVVYDFFNTFETRREFDKSIWPFGKIQKGEVSKYYYKNSKGNVKESDLKEDYVRNLIRDNIITLFANEEEFKKSGEVCGCLDDTNQFIYYKSEKLVDESAAIQVIIDNFEDGEIEEAYNKHMYGSPNEIKEGVDYWGIQYYCVYEKPISSELTAGNYKTKQEYIINHEFNGGDRSQIKWESQGNITIDDETNLSVISKLEYDPNAENKTYVYPHDKSTDGEKLINFNYIDLQSLGLNSTYEVAREQDNTVTCSFGEFYAASKDGVNGGVYTDFVLACEEAVLKVRKNKTGDELVQCMDEARQRIKYIADILEKNQQLITSISVLGDASVEGNDDKNNSLATNRSETLYGYLELLKIGEYIKNKTKEASKKQGVQNGQESVSDLQSKKDRNVKVAFVIGADDKQLVQGRGTDNVETNVSGKNETQNKYRRYDDERLFFQLLRENDNIAYTNLIKKVRYFSPAFHSITPEGFNARLTFLQQCTRQGPTVTASDIGQSGTTAGNLAFGRAPFCVLRLGDFLNTKIVVKSVNITYPDNLWDLNHDGIGAQFMMAKVSMNVEIIGGSDISAPIKRLQNAVSFNYYANTSIYDNRSDIAQYNGDGTISSVKTWNPNLKPRQ